MKGLSSTIDKVAHGAAGARDAAAEVSVKMGAMAKRGMSDMAADVPEEKKLGRGAPTALFNVKDLANDFDQDGVVSVDERYVSDSLKALATEDGDICAQQLYLLLVQYAAMRKGYRLVKWFAVLLAVAFFAQVRLRVAAPALHSP